MPDTETRFAVLIFTDIVGSTALKAKHGVPAYAQALRTHNDHFERIARECLKTRTIQGRGDGYFAEAGSVTEAVRFALLFAHALREGPWGLVQLTSRIGIHAGEISMLRQENDGWIVGPAADLASRIADLALSGQILLTRLPFDEARHFIREHPRVSEEPVPALSWLAHGPYLLKGWDGPMEVFEVGAQGRAPLTPPPDTDKAKRAIRPGEEETLGWRPAVGLEIPGRTGWHITAKLGAGGFGEVWVGEHGKLHERRAFKFCFDDERLRALKREVTLLRLLRLALGERDDIVRIHELRLDQPPFYLESDLAPHGNLLQWAERQGGLSGIPLIKLIVIVANTATALAAAHSIGVLHKDIKPTNILIFDGTDGEPRPRLVDFGIGTLADLTVLSQFGVTGAGFTRATIQHSTGTPTYSPPEYLAGRPYTIQGDIYGLGVLLYQLLTARPLDPLASGWERDVADPLLREDISVCVDGDPGRRLASAADLAERLLNLESRRQAILEREHAAQEAAARAEAEAAAVRARLDAEASAAEARARASRFRRISTAFALLALLAVIGASLAFINQKRATAARNELARKKGEADRKNEEYHKLLAEAARSERLVAEDKLQSGEEREALAHLAHAMEYDPESRIASEKAAAALNGWRYPPPLVVLVGHLENVGFASFSADRSRILTTSWDGTARIWDAATGEALASLDGHGEVIYALFNPDGTRILTVSRDSPARVWETATGKMLVELIGHSDRILDANFSADGARIVTASADATARIWETNTGKTVVTLQGHTGPVYRAEFNETGTQIVTASDDTTARVWDAATGQITATIVGRSESRRRTLFSPGCAKLAISSEPKQMQVIDIVSGKVLCALEDKGETASFSGDGTRIVIASGVMVRVWEVSTGRNIVTLEGHTEQVNWAEFNKDGTLIVTASDDGTARLWDAISGETLCVLAGHTSRVYTAAFSADGRRIVTSSKDRTARVWDATSIQVPRQLSGHTSGLSGARFSMDGSRILTIGDNTARVWDANTGKHLITLTGHNELVVDAQFSADNKRVTTASHDGTARVWNATTGEGMTILSAHTGKVTSAKFDRSGTHVITTSADKSSRIWNAATGETEHVLEGHTDAVENSSFSSDGKRILTYSEDGTARVWDATNGRNLSTLTGHSSVVRSARYSADGGRIVTTSDDNTGRVWDANTGQTLTILRGHAEWVWSGRFSSDGSRIATSSWDNTARIWNSQTGDILLVLEGHTGPVYDAQFGEGDARVLTASYDGTARVWDAMTGEPVATLAGHSSFVYKAEYNPNFTRIVTSSADHTARVWELLTQSAGSPPEWFPDFLCYMAQMHLGLDGRSEALKAEEWLALRERMHEVLHRSEGQDTAYVRILRRFVLESEP